MEKLEQSLKNELEMIRRFKELSYEEKFKKCGLTKL